MDWRKLFSPRGRQRREAAAAVALASGMLQRCPVCHQLTDKLPADALREETDRLAERWVADGDPRVAVFEGDVNALKRTLREVRGRAGFGCLCDTG